jgi:hypothetical protein
MNKNPGTASSEFLHQELYVAKELNTAASNILKMESEKSDTLEIRCAEGHCQ